jgi:GNAT superfamily N-acetyltransferase
MVEKIVLAILPAAIEDSDLLTEIAFRSKAYWGYPPHWLESWRGEIEVTMQSIQNNLIFKAVNEKGEVLGFYRLEGKADKLILTGFWVLPGSMSKGIGRSLYTHMLAAAKKLNISVIEWESDPNTAPFYTYMGAQQIGKRTYTLDGKERTLPIMQAQV